MGGQCWGGVHGNALGASQKCFDDLQHLVNVSTQLTRLRLCRLHSSARIHFRYKCITPPSQANKVVRFDAENNARPTMAAGSEGPARRRLAFIPSPPFQSFHFLRRMVRGPVNN